SSVLQWPQTKRRTRRRAVAQGGLPCRRSTDRRHCRTRRRRSNRYGFCAARHAPGARISCFPRTIAVRARLCTARKLVVAIVEPARSLAFGDNQTAHAGRPEEALLQTHA